MAMHILQLLPKVWLPICLQLQLGPCHAPHESHVQASLCGDRKDGRRTLGMAAMWGEWRHQC